MKKSNLFVFAIVILIVGISFPLASSNKICSKGPFPSPQNYTVTVNIDDPDCAALEFCYFEVVLYRGNTLNDWQAIDRKAYIYGTNSYVFNVSVDPNDYIYIGTKMQYQPGTSCSGYQHDISDFDYMNIATYYPNGGSFSLALDPCN